eukprot:2643213-Amphidinium_carterae.1
MDPKPSAQPRKRQSKNPCHIAMAGGLCFEEGCNFTHEKVFNEVLYKSVWKIYGESASFCRCSMPKHHIQCCAWEQVYEDFQAEYDLPTEQEARMAFVRNTVEVREKHIK